VNETNQFWQLVELVIATLMLHLARAARRAVDRMCDLDVEPLGRHLRVTTLRRFMSSGSSSSKSGMRHVVRVERAVGRLLDRIGAAAKSTTAPRSAARRRRASAQRRPCAR
jgi:hypothetical protein